jgi:hypothetical protein
MGAERPDDRHCLDCRWFKPSVIKESCAGTCLHPSRAMVLMFTTETCERFRKPGKRGGKGGSGLERSPAAES